MQLGLGVEGPLWCGPDPRYLAVPENAGRIRRRLEEAEARASEILDRNLALLESMTEALLRDCILEGEELGSWLAKVVPEA